MTAKQYIKNKYNPYSNYSNSYTEYENWPGCCNTLKKVSKYTEGDKVKYKNVEGELSIGKIRSEWHQGARGMAYDIDDVVTERSVWRYEDEISPYKELGNYESIRENEDFSGQDGGNMYFSHDHYYREYNNLTKTSMLVPYKEEDLWDHILEGDEIYMFKNNKIDVYLKITNIMPIIGYVSFDYIDNSTQFVEHHSHMKKDQFPKFIKLSIKNLKPI